MKLIAAAAASLMVYLSAIAVTSTPASAAAPTGTVTRAEYRAIQNGMTRKQVERIFKATPVCKTFDWVYDDGMRTTGYQYRTRGGRCASVEFNNFEVGHGKVRVDSKEFDHERYLCSTGTEYL